MGNLIERHNAKYHLAIIAGLSAILIFSLPTRMRSQQASTGSVCEAGRDTVAHFKLPTVGGGFMTSEELKGKVTVVDVWATWCGLCVKEIPIYNRLYNAFEGQDVAIVGIAVESPCLDIPLRIRQLGIRYPILIGDDQTLSTFGRIQGFPTTVVINKEGKIYKQYMGAAPNKEERIKQDIEHLLAQGG